jgi:hypothetical protein
MEIYQARTDDFPRNVTHLRRRLGIDRGFKGRNFAAAESHVEKAIESLRRINDTTAFQQEIKSGHSLTFIRSHLAQ